MKKLIRNRTFLGVLCILLALGIVFAITPLYNDALQSQVEIVRVNKKIDPHQLVTNDILEVVSVGGHNLPEDVIKDRREVIGKYATAQLLAGDYILPGKLTDQPDRANSYLYYLDGTRQAISLTIKSLAAGLSAKVEPGDIVQIIATEYGDDSSTQTPPELTFVEVLAVTSASGADGESAAGGKDEKELPATVTLLAYPQQAVLLADLEANGQLHMSLVYRGDAENAQKFLESQDAVLAQMEAAKAAELQDSTDQPQEGALGYEQ